MVLENQTWLSIVGAVSGAIGMVTGLISVYYTRRQTKAVEGAMSPDLEISEMIWAAEPQWLRITITARNRTGCTWNAKSVRIKRPPGAKVIAVKNISSYDDSGKYVERPLSDIDTSSLSNETEIDFSIAPLGENEPSPRGFRDTARETFLVYLGDRGKTEFLTRSIWSLVDHNSLSINLNFSSSNSMVRVRDVTVKSVTAPMTAMETH